MKDDKKGCTWCNSQRKGKKKLWSVREGWFEGKIQQSSDINNPTNKANVKKRAKGTHSEVCG